MTAFGSDGLWNHPARPWVGPFAVFCVFLGLGDFLGLGEWEYPFRAAAIAAAIWFCSREILNLRVERWMGSVALGAAVFAIWIAPDLLFPAWREHWIFQNGITGKVASTVPEALRSNPMVLLFRAIRAVLLVPVLEELFWRGWLMRWIVSQDFQSVPIGKYAANAFWITAALFAVEHGPFWDVGLLAGIAYNLWAVRTRSLGDCMLAHGITNALLSAYVIAAGQWGYW